MQISMLLFRASGHPLRNLCGPRSRNNIQRISSSSESAGLPAGDLQTAPEGVLEAGRWQSSAARAALESAALLSASMDEIEAENEASGSSRSWGTVEGRTPAYKVLSYVNESTKWAVSGIVFVVLLAAHNEWAAWAVVGAVLSSFLCKVLKHVINEQRPASARKKDPGMPSSHSNSLNFLSVYAALSLSYHSAGNAAAVALAVFTVVTGLFLTWLRVALGYHTWPQLVVGGLLGASTAASWFSLGTSYTIEALRAWPPGLPLLYGATLVGMVLFSVRNVLVWQKERKERAGAVKLRTSDPDGDWMPAPAAG